MQMLNLIFDNTTSELWMLTLRAPVFLSVAPGDDTSSSEEVT